LEKAEEENSQLHSRLSELVKTHTQLEECVQNKDRVVSSLQQELENLKKNSALNATHVLDNDVI
jgi:hypothetical protein